MSDPRTYVVIGATGGIGSDLCRRLAAGNRLYVAARGEDRLDALASEVGATAVLADATRAAEVDALMQRALDETGRLDGAVNCAGSIMLKPAHLTSDAEWDQTLATNLTSSFHLVRAAARRMMRGGGSIVLCASAAARTGLPNHDAIAAAKAGVMGLTLSSAATYARYGVRVNCVAPGLVRTPLSAAITGNEVSLKASTAMHPLGRIGEPGDVASAIAWLLSAEQGWVTGQVLGVDGGLADLRPFPRA